MISCFRAFRIPICHIRNCRLSVLPRWGGTPGTVSPNIVNSQIIQEQAQALASNGMKDAGYEYVVIDEGWWLGESAMPEAISS